MLIDEPVSPALFAPAIPLSDPRDYGPYSRTDAKPIGLADGEELDAFVDRDLALVEFYTKGCPMCRAMGPVPDDVARATDVAVGPIDLGEDVELVERFSIRSVTTLLPFRDGEELARTAEGF